MRQQDSSNPVPALIPMRSSFIDKFFTIKGRIVLTSFVSFVFAFASCAKSANTPTAPSADTQSEVRRGQRILSTMS